MTNESLRRQVEHMTWADGRVLDAVRALPSPPAGAVRILAHLLAAEEIWLLRLEGADSSGVPVWPEDDLDGCVTRAGRVHGAWMSWLDRGPPPAGTTVHYRNSAGARFSHPADEILTHVFLHGAHHRGQLLRIIRDAGGTPPGVDYIVFVRERGTGAGGGGRGGPRVPGGPTPGGMAPPGTTPGGATPSGPASA